jgi:hypothetical protein
VMTAETFILRPDKAVKKLIRETRKPENLTVNNYVNRLQVLNNFLTFLPGNVTPLSTSEIRDIIEENVPVHWKTKYENADLNLETIPELTGYFTRLEGLDRTKEKTPYKAHKDIDKNNKNEKDRYKSRGRDNGKADNKPSDKSTFKYCSFHKSNSHDTSECKAKKNQDLKQTNKYNQEVNVITPLPDSFCYEMSTSSTPSLPPRKPKHTGYDDLFNLDHNNYVEPKVSSEEANMISKQDETIITPTITNINPATYPTVLATREIKTELMLTFKNKSTREQHSVNCLIDTGCSKGLICETLVHPTEKLNQQALNWMTQKGEFVTIGSAQNSFHIPAFTTHREITTTFDIMLIKVFRLYFLDSC